MKDSDFSKINTILLLSSPSHFLKCGLLYFSHLRFCTASVSVWKFKSVGPSLGQARLWWFPQRFRLIIPTFELSWVWHLWVVLFPSECRHFCGLGTLNQILDILKCYLTLLSSCPLQGPLWCSGWGSDIWTCTLGVSPGIPTWSILGVHFLDLSLRCNFPDTL